MRFSPNPTHAHRLLALAVAATIAVTAAATARADAPIVVEKQVEVTRTFAGSTGCQQYGWTFTFTEVFDITRSASEYVDRDGNVLRTVRHVRFRGTATNDATGGTLAVNGVRHLVEDYVNGTFTETGVLRHVTAPGSGNVLHESGRLVEGVDGLIFAGPKQLFAGELEAFCEALAGS